MSVEEYDLANRYLEEFSNLDPAPDSLRKEEKDIHQGMKEVKKISLVIFNTLSCYSFEFHVSIVRTVHIFNVINFLYLQCLSSPF